MAQLLDDYRRLSLRASFHAPAKSFEVVQQTILELDRSPMTAQGDPIRLEDAWHEAFRADRRATDTVLEEISSEVQELCDLEMELLGGPTPLTRDLLTDLRDDSAVVLAAVVPDELTDIHEKIRTRYSVQLRKTRENIISRKARLADRKTVDGRDRGWRIAQAVISLLALAMSSAALYLSIVVAEARGFL